jgi:hypothetical protein
VQAGALRCGTAETIRAALLSAVAAETGISLIPLGTHVLRGYRIAMRRLHRAGELSRQAAHVQTRDMGYGDRAGGASNGEDLVSG